MDVEREPLASVEEIPDRLRPDDIGQFMGIGHDGRRPVGEEGHGQGAGRQQGAFQMDVSVHEPRADVASPQIDDVRAAVPADTDDRPVMDGHVGVDDFVGQDIDDASVRKHQIGGDIPFGRADPAPERLYLCKSVIRLFVHSIRP